MVLRSIQLTATCYGASPLELSTLMEVTEVGTIYSNKSCTRPAR